MYLQTGTCSEKKRVLTWINTSKYKVIEQCAGQCKPATQGEVTPYIRDWAQLPTLYQISSALIERRGPWVFQRQEHIHRTPACTHPISSQTQKGCKYLTLEQNSLFPNQGFRQPLVCGCGVTLRKAKHSRAVKLAPSKLQLVKPAIFEIAVEYLTISSQNKMGF